MKRTPNFEHPAQSLKSRNITHAEIVDMHYSVKFKEPWHAHSACLTFVCSGTYLEKVASKSYSRLCSTLIFLPPQQSHSAEYEEPVRTLTVQIDDEQFARLRDVIARVDAPLSCRSEPVSWLGTRLSEEIRQTDAASGLAIEGLLLEMFAELTRSISKPFKQLFPAWLNEAKDYLHDNFTESFGLADVAKVAGVHPVHFARVFRARFGCTVGDYVRRLRVEFACRQIVSTDLPLSQIACAAGFSDQSHLVKIFKRLRKLTPHEYRKIYRAE